MTKSAHERAFLFILRMGDNVKKLAIMLTAALLLGACGNEKEIKPTATKQVKTAETLSLTADEKIAIANKIKARIAGRPLVRDTEEQSGVMYVDLINLNDTKQPELYMLSKTPTGYLEEVWGVTESGTEPLYQKNIKVTETTQRAIVMRNDHYFLGHTIAYEKEGYKHLESKFQHVGTNGKLVTDEGYKIELPIGSNTPTENSKNIVTDSVPTLSEYERAVKSYKVKQLLLKNEQGIVSMNVAYNLANAKLDDIYQQLTGHTYQVKTDIATISDEDQTELMTYLAALSLYHEDRDMSKQTDKTMSTYAARDIANGALRFFDVHFTDIAQSVKTVEGQQYIGYERAQLDPLIQKIFGRTVHWQDVKLKGSKLPADMIAADDYIYLPKTDRQLKATLPVIEQLIPMSDDTFYVEFALYQMNDDATGYAPNTFLAPMRVWSDDMLASVKIVAPRKGYAIVQKTKNVHVQKIIFGKTLSYDDIITSR